MVATAKVVNPTLARILCFLVALALWATGAPAYGQVRKQEAAKAPTAAQEYADHLRAAARAAKERNWLVASAEYAAAHAIQPGPTTLAGMAEAAYELHRWLAAYDHYSEYLREVGSTLPAQVRAAVSARIKEADSHLGELALTVKEPGASIELDKTPLGLGPVERTTRIEAGPHVLRVTKVGFVPVEKDFDVRPQIPTKLDIELTPIENRGAAPSEGPGPDRDHPPPEEGLSAAGGHGSKSYRPMRVDRAPTIDGSLDDEVWQKAPKDARFASERSIPYGKPSPHSTTLQVAYAADNLYLAFRCAYAGPGPRDDAIAPDEPYMFDSAERVGAFIDGRHDHSSSKMFFVNRSGDRLDVDLTSNGNVPNPGWRGIWQVAAHARPDGWTAEFAIPWSTLEVPRHSGEFDIGINFARVIPLENEEAYWILPPPETPVPPSNYGHLTGLRNITPPHYLYLQPYGAAFLQSPPEPAPALLSFAGTEPAGFYGGVYARVRPSSALQVDATFNPDFSQVTPDQALSNLDRFELFRPELRPFFSDDLSLFTFGFGDTNQSPLLFYSRRIGLQPDPARNTRIVPLVVGTKAVARPWAGASIAALAVGLPANGRSIAIDERVSVVRYNQDLEGGHRVGNMMITRTTPEGTYLANGVDGSVTAFDQHLRMTGFVASSASPQQGTGFMGGAKSEWNSINFTLESTLVEIGRTFDPQLGYIVPGPGTRVISLGGAYHPRLNAEFINQVSLGVNVDSARLTENDDLLFQRPRMSLGAAFLDDANIGVFFAPSTENVLFPTRLAGGRFLVLPGRYTPFTSGVSLASAPGKRIEASIAYTEGDLFNGYQRIPSGSLALNVRPVAIQFATGIPMLRTPNGDAVAGFIVSSRALVRYTSLARTALAVEANTLDPRSTIQLVTSYAFGLRSTIAFVVSQAAASVDAAMTNRADRRAVLSFAYGLSPF